MVQKGIDPPIQVCISCQTRQGVINLTKNNILKGCFTSSYVVEQTFFVNTIMPEQEIKRCRKSDLLCAGNGYQEDLGNPLLVILYAKADQPNLQSWENNQVVRSPSLHLASISCFFLKCL